MDELSIPKEPEIELDGGYACCPNCWKEVYPHENCKCGQIIDWSRFRKGEGK